MAAAASTIRMSPTCMAVKENCAPNTVKNSRNNTYTPTLVAVAAINTDTTEGAKA